MFVRKCYTAIDVNVLNTLKTYLPLYWINQFDVETCIYRGAVPDWPIMKPHNHGRSKASILNWRERKTFHEVFNLCSVGCKSPYYLSFSLSLKEACQLYVYSWFFSCIFRDIMLQRIRLSRLKNYRVKVLISGKWARCVTHHTTLHKSSRTIMPQSRRTEIAHRCLRELVCRSEYYPNGRACYELKMAREDGNLSELLETHSTLYK